MRNIKLLVPQSGIKIVYSYMDKTIKIFIEENNLPQFRLKQLNQQYYKNCIDSWDKLTTFPLELREKIKTEITFSSLKQIKQLVSTDKKTEKLLLQTKDNHLIETVLMRTPKRNTICVSCMCGCPVKCKFCATGQMGFNRNLTTEEIIDQIMFFQRELHKKKETITNIVFMGMGEPMLNSENVENSIKIITDKEKLGLSPRRVTVSTSGYIKQLKTFLDKNLGVKIAISLHAPNQETRERIMPTVAKTNKLNDLMDTLIQYQKKTNKRVTYEYLLLNGINDSVESANQLCKLLKYQICLVNLINYNKSDNITYQPATKERIAQFQNILSSHKINSTIRNSFGNEIMAACGQLANQSE